MHPGRILGIVVGLVILITIFFVPLAGSQTLYGKAGPLLSNVAGIQSSGNSAQVIASDYVTIIAFILLVIAGVVGIFPLGTGVLGVVAMALLTVGPALIYPNSGQPAYASAFYLLWGESIVALIASFWHHRGTQKVTVQVQPTQPA